MTSLENEHLSNDTAASTNVRSANPEDSLSPVFDWKEFPILDTPRLILRKAVPSDRTGLFALYADEEVMRYMPLDPFESVEEADDEMSWHARIFREQTGIRWMIEERATGAFVGTCGFLGIERQHSRMEIGYDLARQHWGKGLMPEAVRAVLDFGFGPLAANKIEARVDPDNAASIRLMDKLGFVREGLLRQHEFEKGRYVDLAAYALLKSDFDSLPRPSGALTAPAYEVQLVESRSEWPNRFLKEKARIEQALSGFAPLLGLEHIGSTAVPGLPAKPILDIAAGIDRLEGCDDWIAPLAAIGYEYIPKNEVPNRHFFRRGEWRKGTHHLHIYEWNGEAWLAHLRFRDYLRAHPEARDRYATLKRELAALHPDDRAAYTRLKSPFIQAMMQEAILWEARTDRINETE